MDELAERAGIERLVAAMRPGATVDRAWKLEGGVSAHVTAVEITLPDGTAETVVVRRHGAIDRGHNPDIARDEYRLLQMLHNEGLAVPAPLHLDAEGAYLDAPCLVVAFVDGTTDLARADQSAALDQLAAFLGHLHAVNLSGHDLSFLPRADDRVGRMLHGVATSNDVPAGTERIFHALGSRWPLPVTNPPALLHGDFWPGNVIWNGGRIGAVLDWEDALIGDPLVDLANCRLELLWAFGPDAVAAFTQRYASGTAVDLTNLPFWDLVGALGPVQKLWSWGLEPEEEARMRTLLDEHIDRALEELGARR